MILNVFLSRREKCACKKCGHVVHSGRPIVCEDEKRQGLCLSCAGVTTLTFLPSGDAALTRRSKKYSKTTAVVQQWNQRRRRYERKGQYVEGQAITLAKAECLEDAEVRAKKNQKAAIVREKQDKIYIAAFSQEIRNIFPSCPTGREMAIAAHACEKHSGRVGRSASAKEFDEDMITRAVIAHIRHKETNYDNQFGNGKRKREIREEVKSPVQTILSQWRKP